MTRNEIEARIRESADTVAGLARQAERIEAACRLVVEALQGGGKLLAAGNGGSAAEAMHMAEELLGRFRSDRRPLPAVALPADGTAATCIGNDFGFDRIFSRQVEALGRRGDVLLLLSTSGRSPNLLPALEAAQRGGLRTVCLLGAGGGPLAGRADCDIVVESAATERVQEAHQVIVHLILEAVEEAFGGGAGGQAETRQRRCAEDRE